MYLNRHRYMPRYILCMWLTWLASFVYPAFVDWWAQCQRATWTASTRRQDTLNIVLIVFRRTKSTPRNLEQHASIYANGFSIYIVILSQEKYALCHLFVATRPSYRHMAFRVNLFLWQMALLVLITFFCCPIYISAMMPWFQLQEVFSHLTWEVTRRNAVDSNASLLELIGHQLR